MMLRRHLPQRGLYRPKAFQSGPKVLNFGEAISKRDYVGALTILEFNRDQEDTEIKNLLWSAYCNFHCGNYVKAQSIYVDLLSGNHGACSDDINLYLACVYFYMQMYDDAQEAALRGPQCSLQSRLLIHIRLKKEDENLKKNPLQSKFGNTEEDQLSLAAMKFLKNDFQGAIDICKKMLIQNSDNIALNIFVAMCYFKLDYYDVSLEILSVYLQRYPDSPVAVNLKACNNFRLYNGKVAEDEIKSLGRLHQIKGENDLIQHNMIVFSGGENALQLLPSLIDIFPEARLNLAIYFLKCEKIDQASSLLKDLKASNSQEKILLAIINSYEGQIGDGNPNAMRKAQTYFQSVGASPSECDTIPGRQCMASCFYLLKQFNDVIIYLNSIKSYMNNDDDFNWNYGISLASVGDYKSASEAFLRIHNKSYKRDIIFMSWLSRCYIMNCNPDKAWEIYCEDPDDDDSPILLQLIANECYRMGHFLTAAKAFNELEKEDNDPEFWEGKRGSCIGVFQQAIASKQRDPAKFPSKKEEQVLNEIIDLLRSSSNPQAEFIIKIIKNWCRENLERPC